MKRVMIDFETLGNGKTTCLAQVGACYFELDGTIVTTFKKTIDAEDSVRNGGMLDASTVYWWLEQSEEARKSLLEDKLPEREAISELNLFLKSADEIWSHATFDFVILIETLKRLDIKPSTSFRIARDIRTLKALSGLEPSQFDSVREGTHHDALADAIYQAKYTAQMLRTLNVNY